MAIISKEVMKLHRILSVYQAYPENTNFSSLKIGVLNINNKDEHYEVVYPFRCRELLSIALIASTICKEAPEVCYLTMHGKEMATDKLRLSANINNEYQRESFLKFFPVFIADYEKALGAEPTIVYKTEYDDAFVLIGDAKWVSSPLILSIFSMVLRLSTLIPEKDQSSDISIVEAYKRSLFVTENYHLLKRFFHSLKIEALLENYIDIIGNNPMTGINDAALSKIDDYVYDSGDYISVRDTGESISFNDIRGGTGFSTLGRIVERISSYKGDLRNISYVSNEFEMDSVVGYDWVVNYIEKIERAA
jgi:hypothetical protein